MLACHLQIHADQLITFDANPDPAYNFGADPYTLRFCHVAEYSSLSATLLDKSTSYDKRRLSNLRG
jgi:hypothetical protein